MDQPAIIASLANEWQLAVPVNHGFSIQQLEERINYLLVHDFDKLISLLYRMDVSEKKLKQELQQHPRQDAAHIIAALVIEREWQKMQSRKEFSDKQDDEIPDEDKW